MANQAAVAARDEEDGGMGISPEMRKKAAAAGRGGAEECRGGLADGPYQHRRQCQRVGGRWLWGMVDTDAAGGGRSNELGFGLGGVFFIYKVREMMMVGP